MQNIVKGSRGGDLHYLMQNINRLGADIVKFVYMLHEVEKKSIFQYNEYKDLKGGL